MHHLCILKSQSRNLHIRGHYHHYNLWFSKLDSIMIFKTKNRTYVPKRASMSSSSACETSSFSTATFISGSVTADATGAPPCGLLCVETGDTFAYFTVIKITSKKIITSTTIICTMT